MEFDLQYFYRHRKYGFVKYKYITLPFKCCPLKDRVKLLSD